MNKKPKFNIDIPVLLVFFTRHEHIKQVFDQVRKARPSKLFLYQDGPRQGRADDVENITKCRAIVEQVDWNCEVFKKYQDTNIGCDPSMYLSIKWMFSHVDRGLILEDDVVPSLSLFPFTKILLDKYEYDNRVGMICGMNHLGEYNAHQSDYFFSRVTSIWGWATWKRTIDLWDENLTFLEDTHIVSKIKQLLGKRISRQRFSSWFKHKLDKENRIYFESLVNSTAILNSQLSILPSKNLISNIGISEDGAHYGNSLHDLPKRTRNLLFMNTAELSFPLREPKYFIDDVDYTNKVYKTLGWSIPKWKKLLNSLYLKVRIFIRSIFST